jgi:hypothetical protein
MKLLAVLNREGVPVETVNHRWPVEFWNGGNHLNVLVDLVLI